MPAASILFRTRTTFALAIAALAAAGLLISPAGARAQSAGSGAVEAAPSPAPTRHKIVVEDSEVEPARARVKLKEDAWVYTRPARLSRHVARVHAGKFINVTGATRYYLRVELKNSKVGYIAPAAVSLVRPADKTFALTSDSPVYDQPNRWAKKVSEVHKGHNVHVVGMALDYMRIRMKSGLEGYVPMTALE